MLAALLLLLARLWSRRRGPPNAKLLGLANRMGAADNDPNYNRCVSFHHIRYNQPLLSCSDKVISKIYPFLQIPAPPEDSLPQRRTNCAELLQSGVKRKDPDTGVEQTVAFMHDGFIDALLEELLDHFPEDSATPPPRRGDSPYDEHADKAIYDDLNNMLGHDAFGQEIYPMADDEDYADARGHKDPSNYG